jgi:hypothetical protein
MAGNFGAALTAEEAERAQNARTVMQLVNGYWVSQVLRATADLSLADHIAAGATTAAEIAKLESSDPHATYRLLRAAASVGLFAYEGDHRFSVTPLGELLRSGVPSSLRELALVMPAHFHWQAWETLPESVRAGTTRMHGPLGLGPGRTGWDYMAAHPEEAALFGAAMSNSVGTMVEDLVAAIDVGGVGTAIDVGGSNGAFVQALMEKNPELTGIVLERENVVGGAVAAAEKAGLAHRFTGLAGDFFDEVPPADLYLLKLILHDWNDESCLSILGNCRASARPGARAVVVDWMIEAIGRPDFAAVLDLNMLVTTEGMERDVEEFDALFAATGWRRISTKETRSGHVIQELSAI